jgi:hypothetical protein
MASLAFATAPPLPSWVRNFNGDNAVAFRGKSQIVAVVGVEVGPFRSASTRGPSTPSWRPVRLLDTGRVSDVPTRDLSGHHELEVDARAHRRVAAAFTEFAQTI